MIDRFFFYKYGLSLCRQFNSFNILNFQRREELKKKYKTRMHFLRTLYFTFRSMYLSPTLILRKDVTYTLRNLSPNKKLGTTTLKPKHLLSHKFLLLTDHVDH